MHGAFARHVQLDSSELARNSIQKWVTERPSAVFGTGLKKCMAARVWDVPQEAH